MNTQKSLVVLTTISLLALSVSCSDRYKEGFDKGKAEGYQIGYDDGYDDGYADGDEAGYARARALFMSADYSAGFADGRAEGITVGYNQGYIVGKVDGRAEGYSQGYNTGKVDGRAEGYTIGYDNGYDDGHLDGRDSVNTTVAYNSGYNAGYGVGYNGGYDDGHLDGQEVGYDRGYDDGFGDGYDVGYGHGFDDGYGLSVGKTQKLAGYANLLSMAHNDLVDYSKISAPKKTARGLVANGQLLFSEVSLTNKDTLKRAAAVEKYLVLEMTKQINNKLGLSLDRSFQLAKTANFIRKHADKRALTPGATNAILVEVLDSDIKTLETSVESFKKGNVTSFNDVLDRAAKKNGTSPEKMADIVTNLFI